MASLALRGRPKSNSTLCSPRSREGSWRQALDLKGMTPHGGLEWASHSQWVAYEAVEENGGDISTNNMKSNDGDNGEVMIIMSGGWIEYS